MRSITRMLIFCLALLALTLVPSQARAQEVAAFGVLSTSTNREFPSSRGVGVSVLQAVRSDWLFQLSYQRVHDSTVKPGVVCVTNAPPIGCHDETVSTSDSFSGLRFGVMRAVHLRRYARLGAGLGLSFNSIHIDTQGESGRPEDLERPLTAMIGYLALLDVRVSPVPRIPLELTAGIQEHWVHFHSCADPPVYAPFCTTAEFHEAEVGIAYVIG
jgi:hypothetical protein